MTNRYQYKILVASVVTRLEDDINNLGKDGWRVVSWTITDNGNESAIMEKIIHDEKST